MNELQIRKIVRDEMQKNYRSGNPQVPPHTHDGNNGLKINEADLISKAKFATGIRLTGSATDQVFDFDYIGLNPSSISFYGVAHNGSEVSIINGRAELGFISFEEGGAISESSIIQISNSICIKLSGGGNAIGYSTSDTKLVETIDSSGTEVGYIKIIRFTNKSFTIQYSNTSGWTVSGNLLII